MHKNIMIGSVITVAVSWICWWAWMGWDTAKDLDLATGNETGPYEAWQVIGSALCVVALVAVATVQWGPLVATVATTVGYTAGWMITAFSQDEQGLALIGGLLVLAGVAIGSALVAVLARRLVGPART
ncbi:hypothetical protein [Aeromicrobium sp.]|uniref:hypothetical protein n=1 Tax=Aeromicrobium sp. TaxID=1871063 RepID=UPI0028A6DE9B|nr:hypothetical protein [Aeromicrobium sp.]